MSSPSIAFRIAQRVEAARRNGKPVVALESTVIAHGLPQPVNVETALQCERVIRSLGAEPATIAVVDGVPTIGINEAETNVLAGRKAPDGSLVEKIGLNNLAGTILRRAWGATTVASSLRLASIARLRVFTTGGIGGVHRGVNHSFDVSADLSALGTTPLVCVCSGAKAILDLPKTVECLETLGVPVVGYATDQFPAFYSRESGLPVDVTVDGPDEAARVALNHWNTGGATAVLVCVPAPREVALASSDVERAVAESIDIAEREGIRGKRLTPFLLANIEKLTAGASLEANRALLVNNARVAASIAASLSEMGSGV